MTEGRGRITDPPTTGDPPSATTDALPASTSTRARRNDTTARGSYPALSTRVRIPHPLPSGRAPGWWRLDMDSGRAGGADGRGTTKGAVPGTEPRLGSEQRSDGPPHRQVRRLRFVPRCARRPPDRSARTVCTEG